MKSRSRRFCFLGLFGFLLTTTLLSAQTTGGISGRVTDDSGNPLPGVVAEASGPTLQGQRLAVVDAEGDYRLTLLPPGEYTVKFELDGFATETRGGVSVRLDNVTTLDARMRATASDEITVTGEAPVVDTTSSGLGASLDLRSIQTLPTGRNYSSVVQVAPGISSDANPENQGQSTITVYGSSGAENVFYIDGVNTTNVEYGFQGKQLNFEFIQAVDVKTGGYQAEFGKSTGGVINVITKSGGNEFHGDVFGYLDNDSLQADADSVVSTGGTVQGFDRTDYGIGLGGYLVKDKLWFYGAYDKVSDTITSSLPDGPRAGELADSDSDRDLASAKLTWRLNDNHSVIGTFFQDPREDTGAIVDAQHTLNGDPSTYTGKISLGGKDTALRYQGIFGSNWVISGQIARHEEENSVGPATGAGDTIQFREVLANGFQTGGFGLIQQKEFSRDLLGLTASRYVGNHEIKFGAEYEQQKADVVRRQSGGQLVEVFTSQNLDPIPPIYRHSYWTTPDATVGNAPISQLEASPEHKDTTLFLQDSWRVLPTLTLNVGLRWDRQEIIDAAGTKQIDLQDDFAPRLGFIWDPKGDRTSKVFGSFGYFYEKLPMDLVIRSFSFERQTRIINFSPTDTRPNPAAEAAFGTESAILGGFTEPSDPNIKGQYISEILLGAEREVFPDVAVGVKGIYRKYERVIEDFLCADDGTYCIGNPSEGFFKRVFTLDYSQTLEAPKPKRDFKGVEVTAQKRFSKNWQALASYLWSKLDGNFDGGYAPFTNVGADPNISAAYDYYDFFTNGSDLGRITNDGPLSNDRRHQFKLSGLYQTPWKLSLGASAYYRTGTPLTRYGYSDAYGRYEFFLSKRGGEGRNPASYEADLHLGYPLKVGPAEINFLVDIFNLLDAQRPILLDQRWGFQEADNFSPTPVNPGYGKAILRTAPRSFRLGVRVSF